MNERIKELAEQAWDDTKEKFCSFVDDGGEVDFTFLHAFTEKFALLIVRDSIVDFYRRYLDLESEEDITEQVNRYVKDNFGVER